MNGINMDKPHINWCRIPSINSIFWVSSVGFVSEDFWRGRHRQGWGAIVPDGDVHWPCRNGTNFLSVIKGYYLSFRQKLPQKSYQQHLLPCLIPPQNGSHLNRFSDDMIPVSCPLPAADTSHWLFGASTNVCFLPATRLGLSKRSMILVKPL